MRGVRTAYDLVIAGQAPRVSIPRQHGPRFAASSREGLSPMNLCTTSGID